MLNFVKHALETVKLEDEFLIEEDGEIAQKGNNVTDQLDYSEKVADNKFAHPKVPSAERWVSGRS